MRPPRRRACLHARGARARARANGGARAEIIETAALWDGAVRGTARPLVIFNGELDKLRGGYYPRFVYPKLALVSRDFVPQVEAAYYVHNFKGARPAALFREYPGPWQLYKRARDGSVALARELEARPTLKEVALEMLPTL